MKTETFYFKAATGFGAVIDGSVTSTSSAQVKRDLIRHGLIPVRVWSERLEKRTFRRVSAFLKSYLFRRTSSASARR